MSHEEINIFIAKKQGWKKIKKPGLEGLVVGVPPVEQRTKRLETEYNISGYGPWYNIPNYCKNLNEIHTVEISLSDNEYIIYKDKLNDVCILHWNLNKPLRVISATAQQRAEAIVRMYKTRKKDEDIVKMYRLKHKI